MKKSWTIVLFVAIVIAAFAVRLVPYAASPYPYNVDGYPLVRGAERIIADGRWDRADTGSNLEAYNSKMPLFSYVLAEFSMVLGMEPMDCIQLMTAVMGTVCVIIGFALAKKLTGSDVAALGCAAILALHGFFVYTTVAAWKEGLGILFLLLTFLLFEGRTDPRKRVLLALVLMLLPLTHHLTALVAYAFVFIGVCAESVTRWRADKLDWNWTAREASTLAAPAAFAYLYFTSVNMEFFSDVNNANDAALLGSAIFLGAVVAILLTMPAMSKPWFIFNTKPGVVSASLLFDEKSLALLIGYGALLLNSRINLFPGTQFTSDALLVGVAPLIPIFLLAIAGFNILRYSKAQSKATLTAMALAPLFLLVFASAKAYDPASFFVTYRLLDYIDPFVAVAAGIGLAFLAAEVVKRLGKVSWRGRGAAFALGSAFVILLASTTPLAYDWERVFDISSETKPQQFEAIKWARDSGIQQLSTDQWNSDIAGPYFEISSDQYLPYYLRDGKGYGTVPMLLEDEWKTRGAQTFLSGRMPIRAANFDAAVAGGDLVYSAGPTGQRVIIVIPYDG
jgi:hypothetical protein